MPKRRIIFCFLMIIMVFLLFFPANAEWRTVMVFKKVDVPFDMIYEDLVMKKGQFNFEILCERSVAMFQLKIYKKGKALCALPGKVLREGLPGARGESMGEVPDEPTLQMKRTPVKKAVYIIFEMGKLSEIFPGFIIRFELGYE